MSDKTTSGNHSLRILHVDDEVSLLTISRQILRLQGNFEIDDATSVDEALKKIKTSDYDALVSDFEMPKKNGLQLLTVLREQKNNIPFILFTGRGREEVAIKALNLGADGYVSKQGDPATVYRELSHMLTSIVARRRAEAQVRESEEKFRQAFAMSPDACFIGSTKNGVILEVNDAFVEMFGYSREECVGTSFLNLDLYAKGAAEKDRLVALLEAKGFFKNVEFKFRRKNGVVFPVLASVSMFEMNGRHLFLSALRDISQRKIADDNLQMAAYIFNAASDTIIVHSFDGKIVFFNEAAYKQRGYTSEEFAKLKVKDIDAPAYSKALEAAIKPLIEKGEGAFQAVNLRKDGSEMPVEIRARIINLNNQPFILSVLRDISEPKAAEQQLRDNQNRIALMNEKLRVVGSLTRHDVRNKLSVILAYAYLLNKKYGNVAEIADTLEKMKLSVQETEKIFEFAKQYEQLGVEKLTFIDVKNTVTEAVSLFSNLNLEVINECAGLELLADSFLRQLFYNFIDNTRKHGGTATKVRIHYEKIKEDIHLIYEDNGAGIPHQNKQFLFTKGFSTGGTSGFGLFLIKNMIDVYGWQIKEVGEAGVKFEIIVPRLNKAEQVSYRIDFTSQVSVQMQATEPILTK